MNRIVALLCTVACMSVQLNAQMLSGAEVVTKMKQAFEWNEAQRYAEALDAFLIVGKNTELQRTEEERQMFVCSQKMACMCYENMERYQEGYVLAKKMMQWKMTVEEKKDVAQLYVMNGYFYACNLIKRDENGLADYGRGRDVLQEIAPYADELMKGYVLPKIPLSWYFEGMGYASSQKYEDALACYEKAQKGFHALGNVANEIAAWKAIASAKQNCYDMQGALEVYRQALSLARSAADASSQMDVLEELWKLCMMSGDIEQAQGYVSSMDSLAEVATDEQVKFVYYNQKGDAARSQGYYELAEQWYLKGKNIAESEGEHVVSANRHAAYTKLRNLYANMERYDEALAFGYKAILAFQKNCQKSDVNYYMPYMAMADIYRLKGDKDNCYDCLDTLFISLDRLDEPREQSHLYVTRGRCHMAFGDYASGLADYKKADEVLATKYDLTDGDRTNLRALIGGAEIQNGHYEEAERYYEQYAACVKNIYSEHSMEYIDAQIYLANAEGFAGHIEDGCRDYVHAVLQLKQLMKERFPYLSLSEREGFWIPISSLFMRMTPYALKAGLYQTPFTRSCYDALVLSKAFLLESERSLFDVVKREGTAEDLHDYMKLSSMKAQMKKWEKDYRQYADNILSLSLQIEQLERLLSDRCRGYADITSAFDVDYEKVRQALKPGEILLDFTDFVSESAGRKYAVYVIKNNQEYPLLKNLFAESLMDSLGISRPDMYYDADYASDLLNLMWEPLQELVSEGTTIYYVPSQLLFQVALESLPLADGSLLGDRYHFVRLSSARELVNREGGGKYTTVPQTAVLYGGLHYDLQPTEMLKEAMQYEVPEHLIVRGGIIRGDSVFHELPGTKEEVVKIGAILKKNMCKVTSYMGMEGTEESFLNMHGKAPELLHLATHGFYYTPAQAEEVDYLKGYTDAMSLSGLVLSGGNAAWLGKELPKGVLGGILTAENIARLDLSGVDMVVLSACQTGQGRATSEGLYGLQRAFKKAGAGSIVMTLWKVEDKVTADFMVTFYGQLTDKANRGDKRRAFERAKAFMRERYPDPFNWAAFVILD